MFLCEELSCLGTYHYFLLYYSFALQEVNLKYFHFVAIEYPIQSKKNERTAVK